MNRKAHFRTMVWAAVTSIALLSLTAGAGAVQGDKKIRLLDDCDPATFNAVLGDGACVGDGHTTFDEFIAELAATQDAHAWRNQPSNMHLNVGRETLIENRGGETHTFTEVDEFGGGFVQQINDIGGFGPPVSECNPQTVKLLHPGDSSHEKTDEVGVEKYQCCIHPWMRAEVRIVQH